MVQRTVKRRRLAQHPRVFASQRASRFERLNLLQHIFRHLDKHASRQRRIRNHIFNVEKPSRRAFESSRALGTLPFQLLPHVHKLPRQFPRIPAVRRAKSPPQNLPQLAEQLFPQHKISRHRTRFQIRRGLPRLGFSCKIFQQIRRRLHNFSFSSLRTQPRVHRQQQPFARVTSRRPYEPLRQSSPFVNLIFRIRRREKRHVRVRSNVKLARPQPPQRQNHKRRVAQRIFFACSVLHAGRFCSVAFSSHSPLACPERSRRATSHCFFTFVRRESQRPSHTVFRRARHFRKCLERFRLAQDRTRRRAETCLALRNSQRTHAVRKCQRCLPPCFFI